MATENTGQKGYNRLRQRNLTTGELTGITKANVSSDPDYIPPTYDSTYCKPGPLYVNPNATTFNIASGASSFSISITSNTTWLGSNAPANVSFPISNEGTHDGILTVAVTANTGSTIKTSTFVLRSTDGSISKTITIKQTAPVQTYQTSLGYNNNTHDNACNDANNFNSLQAYVYLDSSSFDLATAIYSNSAGTIKAASGYYSNGEISRYWSSNTNQLGYPSSCNLEFAIN